MIIRHDSNGKVSRDHLNMGQIDTVNERGDLPYVPVRSMFSLQGYNEGIARDVHRRQPMPYDRFMFQLETGEGIARKK